MGADRVSGVGVVAMNRFRRWMQSVPSRWRGTYVEVGAEHVERLGVGAIFEADPALEQRRQSARLSLGDVQVKALRLIETHPDAVEIHQQEDYPPIG